MLLKGNIYLERRFFSIRKQVKWAICTDTFNKLTDEMVTLFSFCFVKIIQLKSDNYALTLRKRLFCDAKPTPLPCKTAAFGMQNNRFRNTLINSWL